MSQRGKLTGYLLFIHAVFAVGAVAALQEQRIWLLAVEGFFACSFVLGFRLVRSLTRPQEFLEAGTDLVREGDFTSRFLPTGQMELDRLITVYNRMIDALREERIRHRELNVFLDKVLQASPVGLLTCDLDGRVEWANPSAERLFGFPAAELAGRTLDALPAPFGPVLGTLAVDDAVVLPIQGRRRVKCGKAQFLDRAFTRTFVTLEELTEELRQTEKAAYEKMIRMMAHEINNTTGAVSSLLHASLQYQDQLGPEDREDFALALGVAIDRAEHLNAFMKGFSDVIRLPPPDSRPCDVERLLRELAVVMQPESERRRITWRWEVQEAPPPIAFDQYQMERVFVNVFKNAMEAIGADGTITVRVGREDGRPFVTIEDTGGGLAPDVQERLFTPFFSTKAQGHGLGLTLVQEILHQHGFDFMLDGEPGGTTRFTVWMGLR